jgi:hypothetical protein
VIGGVLTDMFAPRNASVLDVGCGEGPHEIFQEAKLKNQY